LSFLLSLRIDAEKDTARKTRFSRGRAVKQHDAFVTLLSMGTAPIRAATRTLVYYWLTSTGQKASLNQRLDEVVVDRLVLKEISLQHPVTPHFSIAGDVESRRWAAFHGGSVYPKAIMHQSEQGQCQSCTTQSERGVGSSLTLYCTFYLLLLHFLETSSFSRSSIASYY
jgi:hypothetical protein